MGDRFWSKDPTNSIGYQSTEGESYKGKQPREHRKNTQCTYA